MSFFDEDDEPRRTPRPRRARPAGGGGVATADSQTLLIRRAVALVGGILLLFLLLFFVNSCRDRQHKNALKDYNRLWSRRVQGQGAVVLHITDGLEREGIDLLETEMDRLHRSCRRLVWLNPLLRFEGFEARARGVRAMLPHVDELRPVHNLEAMADLVAALSGEAPRGAGDPRRFLPAA